MTTVCMCFESEKINVTPNLHTFFGGPFVRVFTGFASLKLYSPINVDIHKMQTAICNLKSGKSRLLTFKETLQAILSKRL